MQFDKTPQQFGKDYISIQKLYTGELYEEYKVKNSSSNIFVLKLFNKKGLPPKKIIKEIQIGIHLNKKEEELSHVIKYISSGSELSSKRTYIVYELLEKKSLLDYLVLAPYFEERFGKIVFWKLIAIIQLLHKIGIGGMSISLDKIWIDDNYNLKLSGIDSAQFIKDPKSFKSSLLENDFSQLSDLVLQLISGKSLLTIPQVQLLKYIEKEKYELMWK
jgi:serine/threonine protein kinase